MPKSHRTQGPRCVLVALAVGLVPIGAPSFVSSVCLAHPLTSQDYGGQDPGGLDIPNIDPFGQMPGNDLGPRRGSRTKAARKKGLLPSVKGTTKKADATAKTKTVATNKGAGDNGQLRFSQDIAPILVANCVGCHSGDGVGVRRGKLDLTTYDSLKKGSQKRPKDSAIVIAGKPDESHLVLRIKGDEEPRMPQGGNNKMSDEAIAKIAQWVKEGAKLDSGIDPKKPMKTYAATPEQVAKNQLARLPGSERDKKAETTGLERWKQANPKLKPEIERSDHFIMFSTLPSDRAKTTTKAMETQYGHLRRLLGSQSMDWVEKLSIYVFSSRKDFIEFVRTVEGRDAEADTQSTARLAIPQPYLAVIDPGSGRKDEPAAGKRKARSKRGESKDADSGGADRSLNGVLTEALGSNVVGAAGAPRWLASGLGTYMAAQIEPRSSYYTGLRQKALVQHGQDWNTRTLEALGATDRIAADSLHSIGFALVEAMMGEMRQGFTDFVQGMLQGGDKIDECLKNVYGGTREEFLVGTGEWVASHYGRLQ